MYSSFKLYEKILGTMMKFLINRSNKERRYLFLTFEMKISGIGLNISKASQYSYVLQDYFFLSETNYQRVVSMYCLMTNRTEDTRFSYTCT